MSLNGNADKVLPIVAKIGYPLNGHSIDGGIVVSGATAGQTVKIAEVDDNGVPIAWESVDFPSDGVDGKDGKDGTDGQDGYTPVKGKDYFDGKDGSPGKDGSDGVSATHSWNGTVLTVTSASGTSSADLKGDKGDSIKGDTGNPGADGVSPTVDVSRSGKVTTISITDKNGTKTATINDGADGGSGSNGKDGTSVTVKSVSESTEDGGSNVVTFSDGKTVTIKNGSKGSDANVTAENVNRAIGYTPVDVNDVFEYTENPAFTNLFDTVEIEYGKMINMTDKTVEDTTANLATTGYIPVKAGDVIRVNEDFPLYNSGSTSYILYDADKNALQSFRLNAIVEGNYYVSLLEADSNGYVIACQINKPSSTAFIRICNNTTVIGRNPILTVNEEIRYEMGYGKKLNPDLKVDFSQVVNAPQKNCWSILPYERLNIAYSSIGRKPINTVEHFTDAAVNYGYNVLKCDVRPTADGELVCCHDAGFTFNTSGKITTYDSANATAIRSVTAATVLGYSFPTGEHPCLVGDYLDICRKYGKVAFITIRNEYMDVVIPKLIQELKIHNMTYSAIINCMTYESLVQWRQQDTAVMINYTLNAGVAIDQAQIDRAVGLGYCSLCGFGLTSSLLEPNHTCDFEYARANGVRLLQAIAYKEGSPEACYAMGYDGCQIGYAWNPVTVTVDAYTRAETDNLIVAAIGGAIGGSY